MKLPIRHHPDDARWLRDQLAQLPLRLRERAAAGYSAAYLSALEAEPMEHKRENAARFSANSRLRLFVRKALHGPGIGV